MAFGSYVLNQVTAPDVQATLASTLDVGALVRNFNVTVNNSPIFWQLRQVTNPYGRPQSAEWGLVGVYMIPGTVSLFRAACTGIRFWAAIPLASLPAGQFQALVSVEAVVG